MRENKRKRILTGIIIVAIFLIPLVVFIAVTVSAMSARNAANTPKPSATATASSAPTQAPVPTVSAAPSQTPAPTADPEISLTVVPSLVNDGSYDRDAYGSAWSDVDHNGCDTRNDILQRDLTNIVLVNGDTCKVYTGILADPYTGKTINFQYGQQTSRAVQIDHIYALGQAWYAGASNWTEDTRKQFANDPENLLAVDGSTNASKSDKGPSEWMPTNSAYTCEYSQKFVHIAEKYSLTVTQADYDAIQSGLSTCS